MARVARALGLLVLFVAAVVGFAVVFVAFVEVLG